ncbi:MAG: hypothetical protein OXF76_07000 [Caldilineaceae bacterium]|nr:hypothetical protein [Caldilineaceae bacterium]
MNRGPFAGALLLFFLSFRLVYIPASVLTHTGHGLPWLTALSGFAATFGAEWLTRRLGNDWQEREQRRAPVVAILALVALGFFPEEAPIGVILWAGIGAAWGIGTRGWVVRSARAPVAIAATAIGALLGATGLFGPGSWLAAAVLGTGLWYGQRN